MISYKKIEYKKNENKNSYWIFVLFASVILFQLTALKDIWNMNSLSKFSNILSLVFLIVFSTISIVSKSFERRIWIFYLIPGIMVMGGMFLNITFNVLFNSKLVSIYGLVIPWAAYLSIPSFLKNNLINSQVLWRYYYKFFLYINILGLLEYVLFIYGYSIFSLKETPYGVFSVGNFSLLYLYDDGLLQLRYYSCFIEPGSLAMFLLPAISYAIFNKKYVGLSILILCLILTFSLGGIISFILLMVVIIFIVIGSTGFKLLKGFVIIVLSALIFLFFFNDVLKQAYEDKGNSATVREDNFYNSMNKLPGLMIKYPFGIPLAEKTEDFEKNEDYIGTNFTPTAAFQIGGVLAFFGYICTLLFSVVIALRSVLFYPLSKEDKIVFSSLIVLIPFIVQRTTVWDSALYAFLFAPAIISTLKTKKTILV